MKAYIALIHHPILNKKGELVTTSVTNLDIHDIARTARTFGFAEYHIITPIVAQQNLVRKIIGHWQEDKATNYNPDRQDALSAVVVHDSLEASIAAIQSKEGVVPILVATGANLQTHHGSANSIKQCIELDKRPMLLLFGTGWGLPACIMQKAQYCIEPIVGMATDGYNHLSVRSAVAIYADRFFARSL